VNAVIWVRVAACADVPAREGRAVQLGGRELALFNLGDRFLATDNRCPHRGGPLCDGIVSGTSVVCPLHGWRVDLETGSVERPSSEACAVATYPTRVDGGVVSVAVPLTPHPTSPATLPSPVDRAEGYRSTAST
jgi:nitrite reductase (NADH) small subunit